MFSMLKVPAPVPPLQLKMVLELDGYTLLDENETNWAMGKSGKVPIIIPKEGDFVAVEVMMDTLSKAGLMLGDYFPLRDESARRLGLSPN